MPRFVGIIVATIFITYIAHAGNWNECAPIGTLEIGMSAHHGLGNRCPTVLCICQWFIGQVLDFSIIILAYITSSAKRIFIFK